LNPAGGTKMSGWDYAAEQGLFVRIKPSPS